MTIPRDPQREEAAALASLARLTPGGDWEGRITLPLPNDDTALRILVNDEHGVTEAQREAIRTALRMNPEARVQLEEPLYADYEMMNAAADCLAPIAAPNAVWEHVSLIEAVVPEQRARLLPDHPLLKRRYFIVSFEVDWEVEGSAEVLFRDGEPVGLNIIGSVGWPEEFEA